MMITSYHRPLAVLVGVGVASALSLQVPWGDLVVHHLGLLLLGTLWNHDGQIWETDG
jgi:hypothetical protein